jgi:hypothetical protein
LNHEYDSLVKPEIRLISVCGVPRCGGFAAKSNRILREFAPSRLAMRRVNPPSSLPA